MQKHSAAASIILFGLIVLDFVTWYHILLTQPVSETELHFLDVGQGDAELIMLHNIRILIDAGSGSTVTNELRETLGREKYIDIGLITHPQKDHFGGFDDVLQNYTLGVLIVNERAAEEEGGEAWGTLMEKVARKNVPIVAVRAGDRILYGDYLIEILSPDTLLLQSAEPNDTSIVARLVTPAFRALFTGDIGSNVETYLAHKHNLTADILKIPHHGSKYSSSKSFLEYVQPKVAIIQVGKNRYGHPAPETLERLAESGATVFRTDKNGSIKIVEEKDVLKISVEAEN